MQMKLVYVTKVGENYNFKIKTFSFVIDSGTQMTMYVKFV